MSEGIPTAEPTATPTSAPATPSATPSATPAAATPAATPSTTPPEGYVPSYRLRETREAAAREYQQRFDAFKAEQERNAEQLRAQIRALAGVSQPNPAETERETVKQQFAALYPELAKINDRASDLLGLVEKAGNLESATEHYWENYGRQSLDRLFGKFQETLGGPLTEEAKGHLHGAFSTWVSSSPERAARYASDPTIVEEFHRQFTSSFVDPARRTAQSAVAGRASTPIPQDAPAGAPRLGAPPEQPKDLDGKARNAWAMFNELRSK